MVFFHAREPSLGISLGHPLCCVLTGLVCHGGKQALSIWIVQDICGNGYYPLAGAAGPSENLSSC